MNSMPTRIFWISAARGLKRLLSLFTAGLRPTSLVSGLGLAVAVLSVVCMWRLHEWVGSGATLNEWSSHRGEGGYLLATAAVSRGEWGATFTAEESSRGVNSFPWPVLALHALGMKWGGASGLLLADAVVAALSYALLVFIVRSMGWRRGWENVGAVMLLAGVLVQMLAGPRYLFGLLYACGGEWSQFVVAALLVWGGVTLVARKASWRKKDGWLVLLLLLFVLHVSYPARGVSHLWDRFPRPFVSNLFLYFWLACLLLTLRPWLRRPVTRAIIWLGVGMGAALVLQGDLYSFAALGMVSIGLSSYRFWRRDFSPLWSLLSLVVCAGPFVLQRLLESSDVPARLGVVPLAIGGDWSTTLTPRNAALVLALLLSLFLLRRLTRRTTVHAVLLVGGVAVGFCLTPYAAALILHRFPQPWHYWFLTPAACTFFVGMAGMWGVGHLARDKRLEESSILRIFATRRFLRVGPILVLLVLLLWGAGRKSEAWTPLHSNPELSQLLRELSQPSHHGKVLGTLDPSVGTYWGMWGGPMLVPELFATTLSDREVELRCLAFLREVNASRGQVDALLDEPLLLVTYLGHYKYQIQEARATGWRMPPQDRQALLRLWDAFPSTSPYLCDLLVVETGKGSPSAPRWRLLYQNKGYALYERTGQMAAKPVLPMVEP